MTNAPAGNFYAAAPRERTAALFAFRRDFPERSLRVGGVEWRYRVVGTASRTLMLLPGGDLVNDGAFEFARALSPDCRVVYPAYPVVPRLENLADGLAAVIEATASAPAAMLGASFGGALAQVFVRRHPRCLSRLILSNCGVPLQYLIPGIRVALALAVALPWGIFRRLAVRGLAKMLAASPDDRAFFHAYLAELLQARIDKRAVVQNFRQQLAYHRDFHFRPDDLAGWPGRILLIESGNDVISPRRRRALRESYPQAQLHTFHAGGHATMLNCPEEYLAVVRQFLLA